MQQIATALVKAQKAFAPALKTATNPHFRSKYADLAACIEAVVDALNANGIALIQRTHDSDNGVAIETLFVHESGETISGGIFHVPAAKQDPQGYGSALTYARRYSLMSACGIAPEDDDAESAVKSPPKASPRVAPKQEPPAAPVASNEEIALRIDRCKTIAELQVLYAELNPEQQAACLQKFSLRKAEVAKKGGADK